MPSRAKRIRQFRRRTPEQVRGSSCQRGYDRHWQKARRLKLRQDPLCEDCLDENEDLVTPAVEVHHLQKISDRPDLRLILSNLRSLCKSCHSQRTIRGE